MVPTAAEVENGLFLRSAQAFTRFYVHGYHRLAVLRPCTLPSAGAALLIGNHISSMDPVLIQSVCSRPIVWMMAQEYYARAGMSWFFRGIDAIPVQRSGQDLAATRAAFRALESGRVVGVFPEGRISVDGQVGPFQIGAALLALRGQVPVYPVCLEGTMRDRGMVDVFAYPQEGRLAFGEVLPVQGEAKSRLDLEAVTVRMRQTMLELEKIVRPGR